MNDNGYELKQTVLADKIVPGDGIVFKYDQLDPKTIKMGYRKPNTLIRDTVIAVAKPKDTDEIWLYTASGKAVYKIGDLIIKIISTAKAEDIVNYMMPIRNDPETYEGTQ